MAPPRKTHGRSPKNRQVPLCSHHRVRKPRTTKTSRKTNTDKAVVEEWVYRFLGNLAAIEAVKQRLAERKPAISFGRPGRERKRSSSSKRRFRSPTPYSWDRLDAGSPADALHHSMDVDASDDEEDTEYLPSSLKRAPQKRGRASPYQTRLALASAMNEHKLVDDRSLLEKINGYIRAGLDEGKKRVKAYISKALAFALETGYLVPADKEGKLLRVSPSLVGQVRSAARAEKKPATRRRAKRRTTAKRGAKRAARGKKTTAAEEEAPGEDDDGALEGDEPRAEEAERSADGPKGETSSEESRDNPNQIASRSSSRASSRGDPVNDVPEAVRGSSADFDRKPVMLDCCIERIRPASQA